MATAGEEVVQARLESAQLAVAADERGAQTFDAAGGHGALALAEDAVSLYRLGFAFNFDSTERLQLKEGGDQVMGITGNLDRAGLGGLLHAGGQVDGVAHGGVFHTEVGADLADDDQAGVDADAHLEVEATVALELLTEGPDLFDDSEAGEDGPLRVVFVGDRGAEESEDGIAHEAGEGALKSIDGGYQVLEGAIHDLGPFFRVEHLGHRGRGFDVAEEGGD